MPRSSGASDDLSRRPRRHGNRGSRQHRRRGAANTAAAAVLSSVMTTTKVVAAAVMIMIAARRRKEAVTTRKNGGGGRRAAPRPPPPRPPPPPPHAPHTSSARSGSGARHPAARGREGEGAVASLGVARHLRRRHRAKKARMAAGQSCRRFASVARTLVRGPTVPSRHVRRRASIAGKTKIDRRETER